jgi:hypothetical protein
MGASFYFFSPEIYNFERPVVKHHQVGRLYVPVQIKLPHIEVGAK